MLASVSDSQTSQRPFSWISITIAAHFLDQINWLRQITNPNHASSAGAAIGVSDEQRHIHRAQTV